MSLRTISETVHTFGNSSSATISVVAATPGRTIAIHRLILSASGATNLTVQDSSGAALSQPFQLPAGIVPVVLDTQANTDPWWTTAAGLGVQLAQSGSANVGFDVWTMFSPAAVNVPVFPSPPPSGPGGGGGATAGLTRLLSGSRACLGSAVVIDDGSGQTRVISNIGVVT